MKKKLQKNHLIIKLFKENKKEKKIFVRQHQRKQKIKLCPREKQTSKQIEPQKSNSATCRYFVCK